MHPKQQEAQQFSLDRRLGRSSQMMTLCLQETSIQALAGPPPPQQSQVACTRWPPFFSGDSSPQTPLTLTRQCNETFLPISCSVPDLSPLALALEWMHRPFASFPSDTVTLFGQNNVSLLDTAAHQRILTD
eukprot:GGOE01046894.1.p3 GENE.GGOE01046894.1~~GGOE01046894.1.p3  ORF type:complete len:131 (-),score=12.75 GGOE01046894.1:173-565(-)